eukprot:CAMPEP_0182422320 /NCGR_PEP_ID=MMETSP1167-20130531/7979_1 /TAXON_ID=2988 /ORGANISM="Mallomonas Sp, Strain CCMP3275" /LENGTH=123 /DNA_ID=CAMNT_0024600287 /DNA_START=149 /DNA_END=520 /DNA_ORIENTATION=-
MAEENPESIISKYKEMVSRCSGTANKITELNISKEEHRLVEENLSKLNSDRKAFRLVGGILVERTVGEILPVVSQNYAGITQLVETLEGNLKKLNEETRAHKLKYGIMTQAEREAKLKGEAQS